MVATTEGITLTMWLITGGNGQLGHCLQDQLNNLGLAFVAPTHNELDIADVSQVNEFVFEGNYDVVINTAAWTAVDDAEEHEVEATLVNSEGARNLAVACDTTGARLVHISTDYVFDGVAQQPYPVTTKPAPQNAYGRSKLYGEQAVLEIGKGHFPIIRTAWLYSRYGKNFAKTMAARAAQGLPVKVVDDQFGQPTMGADLARLVIEIAHHPSPPSIVHGTNAGIASWYEFAREIYTLIGADESLVSPVSSSEFPTKAQRPAYSVLDHSDQLSAGLSVMRDWRLALANEIGEIRQSVTMEMQ